MKRLNEPNPEETMTAAKIAYKPVGLLAGALAGLLAGAIFNRLWKLVDSGKDAPEVTDEERGWGEVLAASAMRGLVFAVVRAAIDRGGAAATRRVTGVWPG
jgi:predicted metal-dependent enzyme (double-stranded beta helix superfamily)